MDAGSPPDANNIPEMEAKNNMKQLKIKELKDVKEIDGNFLTPVRVGKIAVLAVGGKVIHTSRVVRIHEHTKDYVHFETLKSHYHMSIVPFRSAAVSLLPMSLAA